MYVTKWVGMIFSHIKVTYIHTSQKDLHLTLSVSFLRSSGLFLIKWFFYLLEVFLSQIKKSMYICVITMFICMFIWDPEPQLLHDDNIMSLFKWYYTSLEWNCLLNLLRYHKTQLYWILKLFLSLKSLGLCLNGT